MDIQGNFRTLSEEALDYSDMTNGDDLGSKNPRHLSPGTVLASRYMIQEVIGIGGMGSVYRARDLHFPNVTKLVAIKEMFNQATDEQVRKTIVQNFEREAHILVTLSHPSVPEIYDFFTFNERSYLVLEYIKGKDLEAIINENEDFIDEELVLQWMLELSDVIAFLHDHKPDPIIFRDIKPSNIMVNQQNHIILIDFGIAKIFNEGQKGTMIGTEGYSPPEQYRGEASQQADVYAIGATMHHLLTRRDPRLEAPFSFGERPIRQINPAVSPELEAVVNKALQYDLDLRYASVQAMRDDLLVIARKTGTLARTQPGLTKRLEDSKKPAWKFICEDEIRGSATAHSGIVYVGALDNNLYALNLRSGNFLWKFAADGGIVSKPLLTGEHIYVGSADSNLYALSRINGRVQWSFQTGGGVFSSPRTQDSIILFGSDDGGLYALDLHSGSFLWKYNASGSIRATPCISADMIICADDAGEVCCLDLYGHLRWRFRAKRGILSSPLLDNGMVFFGGLDSTFYALDAKSGWIIWRYRMGKGTSSSPCKVDHYLFFGSADGHIYCLDAMNAKQIWQYKTQHQVSGSPIVNKESLYCGSADGSFYCLEYRTGKLSWRYATGGSITGTPEISDDHLIVGSHDHKLYAFEV